MKKNIINALSFDVEDWFQNTHLEKYIERSEWGNYKSTVEKNTRLILSILKEKKVFATFFVLGLVAERHPGLVREILKEGHEIATHGWSHVRAYQQSSEEFEFELKKAIRLLESITGRPVLGHRAACFSIKTSNAEWMIDALMRNGILYDSSIYPVTFHDKYGMAQSPRFPHILHEKKERKLLEFPMSTWRVFGINIPIAGGGYFRLYPYAVTRWLMAKLNHTGHPAIVYLHPSEFDPQHPELKIDPVNKFRIQIGIKRNTRKLKRLLEDFRFAPVKEVVKEAKSFSESRLCP